MVIDHSISLRTKNLHVLLRWILFKHFAQCVPIGNTVVQFVCVFRSLVYYYIIIYIVRFRLLL